MWNEWWNNHAQCEGLARAATGSGKGSDKFGCRMAVSFNCGSDIMQLRWWLDGGRRFDGGSGGVGENVGH